MKLKECFNLDDLASLGFHKINEEDFNNYESESYLMDWMLNLGSSRRGQSYFLAVRDRNLLIYASDADGSGGPLHIPEEAINVISYLKDFLE